MTDICIVFHNTPAGRQSISGNDERTLCIRAENILRNWFPEVLELTVVTRHPDAGMRILCYLHGVQRELIDSPPPRRTHLSRKTRLGR